MRKRLGSSLSLGFAIVLALGGCSQTRVADHVLHQEALPLTAERLGRPLLVVQSALPAELPEREALAAQAVDIVKAAFAPLNGQTAGPDSEQRLLAAARHAGLDSVVLVDVENYARQGNLYVAVAVPPVSWDTKTNISLRIKVLDVRSGAVVANLRRDQERGGLYTLRSTADLPGELRGLLDTLVEG